MSEQFVPDRLFAGSYPVAAGTETVVSAAGVLLRGTVLGMVTASGKCAKADSAKTDGTQTPYAVLAQDVDATSGDKRVPVYYTGEFDSRALTFGGSDTATTHKAAARRICLFFRDTIPA